jgi:hypothetical protein
MENNKPIKIFNKTNLNLTSIGVIVDQLNVYNINKELELGAFYIGEDSPQFRYAVEVKKTQINVTVWEGNENE